VDKCLLNIDTNVIMSIKVYKLISIVKNMQNKFITIKKAAEILGVSELTLRNWDNSGKFPAGRHPISNYRMYKVSDIEDLLQEMEVGRGHRRPSKSDVKKLMVKHLTD